MRAVVAVAIFIGSVAGSFAVVTSARAADLPGERSLDFTTRQLAVGQRSPQIVLYDYQSGVLVRSYWRTPWRNRHYFPVTGERPEFGRDEDLSAPSEPSESPQTFRRHWSTPSAFILEAPRRRLPPVDNDQPLPPLK